MVSVILGKDIRNTQSLLRQSPNRISIDIAPGGICGSVGSIAAHTDNTDIGKSLNAHRSRQGQLLISSSQTLPGQMHHRFPAGKERQLSAAIGVASLASQSR